MDLVLLLLIFQMWNQLICHADFQKTQGRVDFLDALYIFYY